MEAVRRVVLLGPANSVHLQRWAIGLARRGRSVTVVTQHASPALPLPPGVDLHVLPVQSGSGYVLNALALRRLLRKLAPDLLHVHYASGYGTLARLAAWRPTLLSVWGSDIYEFPHRSALHRWWLAGNLRFATALASTSQAMADEVRAVWPAAGPIAVTPFGVDVNRFRPAGRVSPAHSLRIGTVKSLERVYGIDLLIEAFASARHCNPGLAITLSIVGDGSQRMALLELARTLGVADEVSFQDAVPHEAVPQALQALDVYVAASRSESFGVAVVEAMACGLPVLVSDAGGLPEVVEHGVSGWVVPRGDVRSLADALVRLVMDRPLRQRLARAARERVLTTYAWEACVDRMLACQDAAIENRSTT